MGAVQGQVLYPDQTPIASARLTLTPSVGPALTTVSEPDGSFLFEQVPAGAFTLTASADDVEPATANGTVPNGGAVELPSMVLRLSVVHTEVNAITQREAAEGEIHSEEHQRILHVVPNFLVVYDAEAVPLSSSQKFRLSARNWIDPVNIGISAVSAGVEEGTNSYPGFGKGLRGYGRRFGASFGDATSSALLGGALLPSIFRQDPRYFFRGTGSTGSRLMFVLKQAVEQKGDNGHWQFAWSNTVGQVGSALLSDTYYPRQGHRWGANTGEFFALGFANTGISNLLQEFVFGHVTTRHSH